MSVDFASLAHLKFAQGLELGGDATIEGQDELLESARLAGRCVMASALAAGDPGAGFAGAAAATGVMLEQSPG